MHGGDAAVRAAATGHDCGDSTGAGLGRGRPASVSSQPQFRNAAFNVLVQGGASAQDRGVAMEWVNVLDEDAILACMEGMQQCRQPHRDMALKIALALDLGARGWPVGAQELV